MSGKKILIIFFLFVVAFSMTLAGENPTHQQLNDDMRKQMQTRLTALKSEYQEGLKTKVNYEAKLHDLDQTLLRISGAIQVIEQMLKQ